MKINLGIIMILLVGLVNAQPNKEAAYGELRTGDVMPNYTFKNLINYRSSTAKYSDFEDRLLILDFWSTGCATCVNLWPEVLQLQEEFKDQVQFILMNAWEDEAIVRKTFARRKQLVGVDVTLPTVCGDRTIHQLFPTRGLPFIVWIYRGKVVSMTTNQELNAKNIRSILNTGEVNMVQRLSHNDATPLNMKEPLFMNGNYGNAASEKIDVIWQSIFTKSSNHLHPSIGWVCDFDKGYRITIFNHSVKAMYTLAYGEIKKDKRGGFDRKALESCRVILDVENPERYEGKYNGQPDRRFTFIYNLFAPPTNLQKLMRRMQVDLDQYVGLEVAWEKKTMECFVLSATDTMKAAYRKGDKLEWMGYKGDYKIKINGISMSQFRDGIARYYKDAVVLDETGINGLIGGIYEDNVYPSNPADLDRALSNHGLRFTRENRVVDVLVLREPSEGIPLFEDLAPIPSTAKPNNIAITQREQDSFWTVTVDPINEAVQYRLECRRADEVEWHLVRYTKLNRTWLTNIDPGEYLIRVAGIAENDPVKTNFEDTSALQYSDEIKLTVNPGNIFQ